MLWFLSVFGKRAVVEQQAAACSTLSTVSKRLPSRPKPDQPPIDTAPGGSALEFDDVHTPAGRGLPYWRGTGFALGGGVAIDSVRVPYANVFKEVMSQWEYQWHAEWRNETAT